MNFPSGQAFQPVVNVSWLDAQTYCGWAGKRLPTEAEWELACKGTDQQQLYPWGQKWATGKANTQESTCKASLIVGSYSSAGGDSFYGAADMIGNAFEWVSSIHKDYPYRSQDGREDLSNQNANRVLRGGSWLWDYEAAQCTHRRSGHPESFAQDIGFRCAKSSAP